MVAFDYTKVTGPLMGLAVIGAMSKVASRIAGKKKRKAVRRKAAPKRKAVKKRPVKRKARKSTTRRK